MPGFFSELLNNPHVKRATEQAQKGANFITKTAGKISESAKNEIDSQLSKLLDTNSTKSLMEQLEDEFAHLTNLQNALKDLNNTSKEITALKNGLREFHHTTNENDDDENLDYHNNLATKLTAKNTQLKNLKLRINQLSNNPLSNEKLEDNISDLLKIFRICILTLKDTAHLDKLIQLQQAFLPLLTSHECKLKHATVDSLIDKTKTIHASLFSDNGATNEAPQPIYAYQLVNRTIILAQLLAEQRIEHAAEAGKLMDELLNSSLKASPTSR